MLAENKTVIEGSVIFINRYKHKVFVRCEIKELIEILALPYLPETEFSIEFPFYEQIEFNFSNGHTCIRALTENNRVLHTVDITNKPALLTKSSFAKAFWKSAMLRQNISESFSRITNSTFPFSDAEVTLENLVFFTRFAGFDAMFYYSIPYEKETMKIDESFTNLDRLKTPQKAIEYVSSFSFAKSKSVRRMVYLNQGLLFYLPECEMLFNAINNIDIFRKIIKCNLSFVILENLHQFPLMINFIIDYCRLGYAVNLANKICNSPWDFLRNYAVYYCSLSDFGKANEQKKWPTNTSLIGVDYSLPMAKIITEKSDCKIGKFSFRCLRNTGECFNAGKDLDNCLTEWQSQDNAVVTVSINENMAAAIELESGRVRQAYIYRNCSINEMPGLTESIRKWSQTNHINFNPYDFID